MFELFLFAWLLIFCIFENQNQQTMKTKITLLIFMLFSILGFSQDKKYDLLMTLASIINKSRHDVMRVVWHIVLHQLCTNFSGVAWRGGGD